MMIDELSTRLLAAAREGPLSALSIVICVAVPLVLGWMHEARFAGECLIVGIRFIKHELVLWWEFLQRMKHQMTTWKSDP